MSSDLISRIDLEKRILWRATRRGFKEADQLIGGYAHRHVPLMPDADLYAFELLLSVPDQDLYGWILKQSAPDPAHDGPALHALQAYAKNPSPLVGEGGAHEVGG